MGKLTGKGGYWSEFESGNGIKEVVARVSNLLAHRTVAILEILSGRGCKYLILRKDKLKGPRDTFLMKTISSFVGF